METDSREYEILINAVIKTKHLDGMTCEIGVREGGATKIILQGSVMLEGQKRTHIAIDPFGNIDYVHWENIVQKLDYTNKMKNKMLMNLYKMCYENDLECLFFPLEDTEFFERYADGVPTYNESKRIVNEYSLVFFDGPHSVSSVRREFDFFKDRLQWGGFMVFDDIDQYPHMGSVDEYIRGCGYEEYEKGECKISYIKI